TQVKGQVYIPTINWTLMLGCIVVVLIFRESIQMQGAYGVAITINMLMTSALLIFYFSATRKSTFRAILLAILLFSIECTFLVSNMSKFIHGGWFTFAIAGIFIVMMYILVHARKLRERHTEFVDLKHYVGMIKDL